MKRYYIIALIVTIVSLLNLKVSAQSANGHTPLNISSAKMLDSADLANKEEGWHREPLPQVGYQALTGISFGAIGSLFNNGKKNDSLFQYANYKFRLDFAAGGSFRSGQKSILDGDDQLFLKFDAPFVGGSRFRLTGEVNLESDPYNLYYGVTTASLRPLPELSQPDNERYNYFTRHEKLANIKLEYMLFHGFIWPFIGFQFMDEQISAPPSALIYSDILDRKITGLGHAQALYIRSGIKYDSRNNADNPSKGIFAEITDEYSPKLAFTGSAFNKVFFHFNYYLTLNKSGTKPFLHLRTPRIFGPRDTLNKKVNDLRFSWFSQNILAVRYALGTVSGNAPFYSYQNVWASEDNIPVLGGDYNLRGFDESRFAGNVINFINIELRASIIKINDNNMVSVDTSIIVNGQKHKKDLPARKATDHYDIALVPFFDIGGVWDKFKNYFQQSGHYKYSGGLGARITLNSDFIVRFDYAVSSENRLKTLTLNHTF